MILLIDNYDSFTYNLVHYVSELGTEVIVRRNDKITVKQALDLNPSGILLSPGPCDLTLMLTTTFPTLDIRIQGLIKSH